MILMASLIMGKWKWDKHIFYWVSFLTQIYLVEINKLLQSNLFINGVPFKLLQRILPDFAKPN